MFNAMNWSTLVAAVLFSASCAMGLPMLLGEPDMQEEPEGILNAKPVESVSSYGTLEQQMEQALAQQIQSSDSLLNRGPVNFGEMQQEGVQNVTPQQIPAESSPQMQPTQQPQLLEKQLETMQPVQPDVAAMLSDQPSGIMQSGQSAASLSDQSVGVMQSDQAATSSMMPDQSSGVMQSDQAAASSMLSDQSSGVMQSDQAAASSMLSDQSVGVMQSNQPGASGMLSDQPSLVMQSDQTQILAAAQAQDSSIQQSKLCTPASDCPEREQEMLTPETTAQTSPDNTMVVMTSEDKNGDTFKLADHHPSTP